MPKIHLWQLLKSDNLQRFFFSEALEDYPDQFLIFFAISSTKIDLLIERIIETPGF